MDMVGEEENPIVEGDAEPDNERQESIDQDIPQGMEKFESLDKFLGKSQDLLAETFEEMA